MEVSQILYFTKKASQEDILEHLTLCDHDFVPALSQRVIIFDYAKKIFEKAITFEAWHNHRLIGLVAAYFSEPATAFVTSVSVIEAFKGKGVASEILKNLVTDARERKITIIHLEVHSTNQVAIDLYKKFGFQIDKIVQQSCQMKLKLSVQT